MYEGVLNIIVSGVGGQGTVLAGKLLAQCALNQGLFVRSAETIGMAQRGGSVLGHVRISASPSQEAPHSPLVPQGQAQLLIGFEPAETLRAYSFCGPDALVISAIKPLVSSLASLQRLAYDGKAQLAVLEAEQARGCIASLILVDNDAVMTKLAFEKGLNVVLLGAALASLEKGKLPYAAILSYDAMYATIQKSVAQRFITPNLRALEIGYQLLCT